MLSVACLTAYLSAGRESKKAQYTVHLYLQGLGLCAESVPGRLLFKPRMALLWRGDRK